MVATPSDWQKFVDPATNAPYWHNRVTRESRWTPPSPTTPQDAMQRPQQTIPRAELAPVDSAPAQTHRLQQDGSPAPPLEAVQPADSASTFVAASVALPPPSTKSGPGTATVVAMDSPPGGPGDAATQSPRPPHIPPPRPPPIMNTSTASKQKMTNFIHFFAQICQRRCSLINACTKRS